MIVNPPASDPITNPWVAVIIYHDDGVPSLNLDDTYMSYFAFPGSKVMAVNSVLMGMDIASRAAREFPLTSILANYPEYQASPVTLDGGEITTVTSPASSTPFSTATSNLTSSMHVTQSSLTTSAVASPRTQPMQEIDSIRQSVQALTIQTSVLLQVQLKSCRSEIRDIQARIDVCEPGSPAMDRLKEELEDAQTLLQAITDVSKPTASSTPLLK